MRTRICTPSMCDVEETYSIYMQTSPSIRINIVWPIQYLCLVWALACRRYCSIWKSFRKSFFVEDMATFQPPLLERQQAPFPAYRPLSEEGLQEKGVLDPGGASMCPSGFNP